MGGIQPWEEARFGMYYFSSFATADGFDFDGEHILEKVSLQKIETVGVVPVGIFHAEKERIHTPTLRQIQPKQTRGNRDIPLHQAHQRNNSSTPSVPDN